MKPVTVTLTVALSIFTACARPSAHTTADSLKASAAEATQTIAAEPEPFKVSILGDSYSTFEGWVPEGYLYWYKPVPKEGRPTDVTEVDQTWWKIYLDSNGYELETNNSYSGSTICNTGYGGKDYSDQSFVNRADLLGDPDQIIVFGGTNDAWADSPLGEYVWSDWTERDLYSYRPATAYLVVRLQELYPDADLLFLINDEIKDEVKEATAAICDHYGVRYIQLEDIDKLSLHPSQKGMRQIADQISQ